MVEQGAFREDLMFRINTFEIHVPSLRERVEDIESLARHIYLRFRPEHSTIANIFSPEALTTLESHRWPGNVRELANVIEHATILCDCPPILSEHLPKHFSDRKLRKDLRTPSSIPMSLKEVELIAIQDAVTRHQGNKNAASEELGISLKTLYNKLALLESAKKAA